MTLVCNRRNSPVLFSTLMQFANDVSQEIRCMVAGYLPYLRAVVDREAIERDVVPAFVVNELVLKCRLVYFYFLILIAYI